MESFIVVSVCCGIAGTVLWVAMLIDCLRHESSEGNTKIVCALVIVLTHWIGGLLYLAIRRPARIRAAGR